MVRQLKDVSIYGDGAQVLIPNFKFLLQFSHPSSIYADLILLEVRK